MTANTEAEWTTFAQDLRAAMDAWDAIMAEAKRQFPSAGDEELYQISAGAMRRASPVPAGQIAPPARF